MMSDNFGPGIVGGVVLVDPVTGLPYKAEGGGGGAVDSVNGKTGAVVLDAEDVGAVPSAEGDAYRAYITNSDGDNDTMILEGLNPLPVTIPVRTETGAIVAATPTEDSHAATKGYVDGTAFPRTMGGSSGNGTRIPTWGNDGNPSSVWRVDATVSSNFIVRRTGTGQVAVPVTPDADNAAASKQYVDLRVPVPPASGTFTLQSVDGVTSWVEV